MAPCNMRCNTCGDYIARGKKFNARKETVENEFYLGLKVFRFYFKCPRCMQEITFKTDPKNYDYVVEHGATPNFKALKLAEQQAIEEQKEKEEEERLNPMKLLENRTQASRREMENLESLENLKEMNQREEIINYEELLKKKKEELENELKRQEEEDEKFVQSIFHSKIENDEDQSDQIIEEFDTSTYIDNIKGSKLFGNSKTTDKLPEESSKAKTCTDILSEKSNESESKEKSTKKRKLMQNLVVIKKKPDNPSTNNTKTGINLLCNYSGSDESD